MWAIEKIQSNVLDGCPTEREKWVCWKKKESCEFKTISFSPCQSRSLSFIVSHLFKPSCASNIYLFIACTISVTPKNSRKIHRCLGQKTPQSLFCTIKTLLTLQTLPLIPSPELQPNTLFSTPCAWLASQGVLHNKSMHPIQSERK